MASKHTIYLPAVEKTVTVGQYVRAVRVAKANPTAEFKHGLTTFYPCTGAEIMRQFREGCHDRQRQRMDFVRKGDRWQLCRADRRRAWFEAMTKDEYRRMLDERYREDGNPRLIGEFADMMRRNTLRAARQSAQRILRKTRRA